MDPIFNAFTIALINSMASDAWTQAHAAVVAIWRRFRHQQADDTDKDLRALRERVLAARAADRTDTERSLERVWRGRLEELLLDNPELPAELERVLQQELMPLLSPEERSSVRTVIMTGSSHGSSTFNQVAGNQINFRP
jgi:hypothetical protein